MTQNAEVQHVNHGTKTAYHMEFGFRPEAAVWKGRRAIRPNFYPLATDLRNWMLQKGRLTFSTKNSDSPQPYTNPYTNDGSILSISYAQVINHSVSFSESTETIDATEAEITRIRLYTEHVLYSARICEAFIKQLLFCTGFPESYYRGAALGSLLSQNCNACRKPHNKPHRISLLGSLAHRYRLCLFYEGCLSENVRIANRRRDLEAAHSGITEFNPTTASKARDQLRIDTNKILTDLVHMLEHLGDIEEKMLLELHMMITDATDVCPVVNAFKETLPANAA